MHFFCTEYVQWVGEMPSMEVKRRRELIGSRELRPGAFFRSDNGSSWRQANQQHVYRATIKEELRPKGAEESFLRIQTRLREAAEEVLKDPDNWIPSIDYDSIVKGLVGKDVIDKIRRTGVLRIRKVLPRELATSMNERIMNDFRTLFEVDPGGLSVPSFDFNSRFSSCVQTPSLSC